MSIFKIFYLLPIYLLTSAVVGYPVSAVYASSYQNVTKLYGFEKSSESNQELSPEEAGKLAQSAILQSKGITIKVASGYLVLSDPLKKDNGQFTTMVNYTLSKPATDQPALPSTLGTTTVPSLEADIGKVSIPLEGSLEIIANTAAFLGVAICKEMPTNQAEAGASMAQTGLNYSSVDQLLGSIVGILTFDPLDSEPKYEIDLNRLKDAVEIYNQVLRDSSDLVVLGLSQNQSFLEVRDLLKTIRSYVP
ncbi:MAG: hypothetical protein ACKO5P_03545 [Nodosilinea sp.]